MGTRSGFQFKIFYFKFIFTKLIDFFMVLFLVRIHEKNI